MNRPKSWNHWPRTLPRWLRGIYIERAKREGGKVHEDLLNIHRPAISPQMTKHDRFVIWFVSRKLNCK